MRNGEPLISEDFYHQLSSDDEFCMHLGRAMLSAGRLESAITVYINQHKPDANTNRANLGRLIGLAEKHELLSNMVLALKNLNEQRNYVAHNIHALFSGLIEETILPRTGLLDSDIDIFIDRAKLLTDSLNAFAGIVEKYNENT